MRIFDFILLVGVIQGTFLTMGLLVKNFNKKKQNYYFFALISLISITLLSKYLFNAERYQQNPHIWYFFDIVAYAIGPLWYFTIQKSIKPKVVLSKLDWLMLSPILYHILFLIQLLFLSKEEILSKEGSIWFEGGFYVFCLTIFIVNGGYLLKAHLTLKQHKDAQFPTLLINGQYAFITIIAIWILSFIASFVLSNEYYINLNAYQIAFVSMAFLAFGLAFLALTRPASFYFLNQTYDGSEAYVLQKIAEQIEWVMQEHEPFLNKSYSLSDLSEAVGANTVLTSKAINRILKTSFADLMNEYRIKHFIKMARSEKMKNLTHWAIAQQAGFGNKVSFYKAFKKLRGTTPKAFLVSMEV
ncbi:MAG: AraC family transcriptional regulator [Bacteroidota bacterium]